MFREPWPHTESCVEDPADRQDRCEQNVVNHDAPQVTCGHKLISDFRITRGVHTLILPPTRDRSRLGVIRLTLTAKSGSELLTAGMGETQVIIEGAAVDLESMSESYVERIHG